MSDVSNEKQWYVVNTYVGHENRVKDNLEKRLETMGISDNLFRIVVAEETAIDIKNEKAKEVVRNIFPGYLFVEMIMTDEAWYVVRNTPGVTGFIGSSGGGAKPIPVKGPEIEAILRRIGQSDKTVEVNFKVGDVVKTFIKDINGEKIALSMKFEDENPWAKAAEKYAIGNVVTGKVVRFASFGAFVELEPGVDGLLHVSQISKERVEKPEDVLKVGQEITAKVVDFKAAEKKISLSIRALDDAQEASEEE